MLIGIMLNIMLYGIMFIQTYLYFSMYKDDPRWIKLFVFVLFLCDTINTGLDIAAIYVPLVNHFGNFEALTRASWMFASASTMTAFVAALVQCFFARRLKVLTSNNWIFGIILLCAVTQLLGGISCTIILVVEPTFANVRRFKYVGIVWNVSAALADVIITAALVWHLWRHKMGVAATDNVINKIIRLTIPTGFLTALFAVMTLLLYFVSTQAAGYNLIFHMPLAKLYTNSLMSNLNSRCMWMSNVCEGSISFRISGYQSGINVNFILSDGGEQARVRASSSAFSPEFAPDRIIIGVESHQMTNFDNVECEDDAPSATSSVPDEKHTCTTEAV